MIEVLFSCGSCGLKKIGVAIIERGADEDILEFVARGALACKAEHDKRSPFCEIKELTEFFVPIEDGMPIGNVRKH